jgi:hypothetical protein
MEDSCMLDTEIIGAKLKNKEALWDNEVTVDMIKVVECRGYVEPWGKFGNQIRYQTIEREW